MPSAKQCLHYLEEAFISTCQISIKSNNFSFQDQNSVTDVFVTLRPPCLCPSEGHKHGVSIQSSINLGDTLLQITRKWKTAETWFLARFFIYQSSIVSQVLDDFSFLVLITWLVKTENKRTDKRIYNLCNSWLERDVIMLKNPKLKRRIPKFWSSSASHRPLEVKHFYLCTTFQLRSLLDLENSAFWI